MAKGVYLDNSTTTKPSEKAISQMMPFFSSQWGVPSAPHAMGQELFPSLKESWKAIYTLIGAKETDDIVFTSSGAEAVNHAILATYFDVTQSTGKNHFITSHIDEAPAIMSIGRLEKLGCVGKMINPNTSGLITPEIIANAISPRTALISLSWGNGLTGVIQPVADIAKLCQERGILLHLDASHTLGKIYYDLEETGATFISFNGDNIHAPKGTGALYIRGGTKCSPFITGGIEQASLRAGSYSPAALAALATAANEALDARDLISMETARLRDRLEMGIVAGFPEAIPFFCRQHRLPHIACIAFPGISNEALLFALNRRNIYACIGGGSLQQIGLVLSASGIDSKVANTAISFSLSRETTEDDIERAVDIVVDTANKMRRYSEQFNVK
jgi:cysteine desulfurase